MANTREILGDQETFEALVSCSKDLIEFVENGATEIKGNAFSYNNHIQIIDLDNVSKLEALFYYCDKLSHFILRSNTLVQLNQNIFQYSPISYGYGTVYVQNDLLEQYKSANYWKYYSIMPISSYPITEFGTITDSWETIANNPNYATDYAIGDTKTVDFGDYGYMNMELVAFDTDDKSDGSGKAHMTWIAKDCIDQGNINSSGFNTNGWIASELRSRLKENVLVQIPKVLCSSIVEVNKTYYDATTATTLSSAENIWIPSAKEMLGGTSYESSGVEYNSVFTNDSSKIKKYKGDAWNWALRTAYQNNTHFRYINGSGSIMYGNANSVAYGVVPGFCIGGKSESQYWTDLVHAIEEGTYHKLYAVGDKLPYTVDGNTYHAVIVGIDTDEDAYGNKIPVTFVTEELYATLYRMNATNTNSGGWKDTEMRNTTLLDIQGKLPEYVENNIIKAKKISKLYGGSEQTTYDKLWIPSMQEMGFTGYESSGIAYSDVFTDANSRKKVKIDTTSNAFYWARSVSFNSSNGFYGVYSTGDNVNNNSSVDASYTGGVALSFCIGLDAEKTAWNALYKAIDDGTYATKYAVGDKLPYTIGDNVYHAVIAGIDVDEDENGNKVPVTFVTEEPYAQQLSMNDTETYTGGWADSRLRKTTMATLFDLLPSHLQNRINIVKKVSYYSLNNVSAEQITYDSLWIPSCSEYNVTAYMEPNGITYSYFESNNVTQMFLTRSGAGYPSSSVITKVTSGYSQTNGGDVGGIALSFSVGHLPEKIQWRMLSDAIEDGTYRDKYHIGDEIPYTTTDGDTYHAVIAAFGGENGDVDADGNAVPVTFITKELYNTNYRMNATATNADGWEVTEMRKTTLPSIRAKMPSYVMDGIISAKKISGINPSGTQETVDELWIPSAYEVGMTPFENIGVEYTDLFTSYGHRIKKLNGTANYYWLRTATSNAGQFYGVNGAGAPVNNSANTTSWGVAIGFCYGAPASSATTVAPTATDVSKAYGVEWDYSQTSPALTRKGLAASFTDPSPATSVSGSGSSPFDSIWPWAGMEVYNITPEGRRIKKGETGFSFTDYDVMVYIPEFWYTAQKDTTNSKWTWAISPTPIAGYEKHPGSGRFVSKYHTSGSASAVASKSGVAPLVSTSQTNFRTYSKNKGDNWYMLDIATWSALQMLYLVEYANFDSQTMLGKGWNSGNTVVSVGGTDSATYHTVKLTGDHNQYRWIEDPFSNAYNFIDGFIGGSNGTYVGTDNTTFNGTATALTQVGSLKVPLDNEIGNFAYNENASWAFIPSEGVNNSNYDTYVCDWIYSQGASGNPATVGGCALDVPQLGIFYLGFGNNATATNTNVSSRLIYLS